jgi:predicted patatin/cPLA2 family phospholipase
MDSNNSNKNNNSCELIDYTKYIKNLVSKLDMKYYDLDMIVSPGGFNIFYAFGVCDFLLECERQKKLKVHRIHGASAGSVVGLLYLIQSSSDFFLKHYEELRNHFDKYKNASVFFQHVDEYFDKYITDEKILESINDKLFIGYHEIKNDSIFCEYKIAEKYKTLNELRRKIKASCAVPVYTVESCFYTCEEQNNYLDGFYTQNFPIVNPERHTLHVNLVSPFDSSTIMIPYKSTCNSLYLEGINDLFELFQTKQPTFRLDLTNNFIDPYPHLTFKNILWRSLLYSIITIYIFCVKTVRRIKQFLIDWCSIHIPAFLNKSFYQSFETLMKKINDESYYSYYRMIFNFVKMFV